MTFVDRLCRRIFLRALEGLRRGTLHLATPDGVLQFGSGAPDVTMVVHNDRLFRRVLLGGDIGLGEAYMDGDFSSPDVVPLARYMLRNLDVLEASSGGAGHTRLVEGAARRLRDNRKRGSRRNIRRHYDLGNDFFRLFLDRNLLYSCAYFESPDDTLEVAQIQKLERICDKLQLSSSDHLLEIGTGWGGFAVWAATRYGCRVTTTTISREQHAHARAWIDSLGPVGQRITLRLQDYRDLEGVYDKIVSIEMFEAVGLRHYRDYFTQCDRLLAPGGRMLLQTITVDDWRFNQVRRRADWIEKYIFPGSELASVAEILRTLADHTTLSLFHAEQIGLHYAHTAREWRRRFLAQLPATRALGYDDRFIRMWDLYLAYCEATFAERHCGDVQLLLTKAGVRGALYGEPWPDGEVPAESETFDRQRHPVAASQAQRRNSA